MYVRLSKPPAVAPGKVTSTTITWGCQSNSAEAEGRSVVQPRVDAWAPQGTEFDTSTLGQEWTVVSKRHVYEQMLVTLICYGPGAPENFVYQDKLRLRVLLSAPAGTVLHDLKATITEINGNAGDNLANDSAAVPVIVAGQPRPKATPVRTVSPSAAARPTPRATSLAPAATASVLAAASSLPTVAIADDRGAHRTTTVAGTIGGLTAIAAGGVLVRRRRRTAQ